MTTQAVRARDLGVPFSGTPGPFNAITDVSGVEVGHTTLISGDGRLQTGTGPVRTGVTAILPRGMRDPRMAFAGSFALNAGGEMTGLAWLDECGFLVGPVMITNTHSVGVVRDATIQWMLRRGWEFDFAMPVVGETFDGRLNDINGFHVKAEHAWAALDGASGGAVPEGNVGGGTGMMCYEFKSGIGTSSRKLSQTDGGHTVGVLVQANYGFRAQLRVAGIPVGLSVTDDMPYYTDAALRPANAHYSSRPAGFHVPSPSSPVGGRDGSIIIVVATDAPLLPHQLRRIAKRPTLAIGRLGGIATEPSGDIFLAFSTANPDASRVGNVHNADIARSAGSGADARDVKMLPNSALTLLFDAVINATEEAIVNSMIAAQTCVGANGLCVSALPHGRLKQLLAAHNVLVTPPIR